MSAARLMADLVISLTVLPIMKPAAKPIPPEADKLPASAGWKTGESTGSAAPPCRRSGSCSAAERCCPGVPQPLLAAAYPVRVLLRDESARTYTNSTLRLPP